MLEELQIENGLLVKYRGAGGRVAVPYGVTSIRENAFSECGDITEILLPSGLCSIGEFAFNNCETLEEVHIPSLEDWLAIDFQGFRANPLSNGAKLFIDGQEATDIVIPNGIVELGQRVFEGCSTLESVRFPESLRTVGKLAFGSCPNLREVLPNDALEEIGYGAFRNCAALSAFSFSKGLKTIQSWAFSKCTALASIVLPDGLKTIERDAFYGCSSVGFVRLPATLAVLPDDVFYGCSSLDAVCIPTGIDVFGSNVFTRCDAIREVRIEGAFLPETFQPPASMEVLVAPAAAFSLELRPSLLLPLAAGFVKLAAQQGSDALQGSSSDQCLISPRIAPDEDYAQKLRSPRFVLSDAMREPLSDDSIQHNNTSAAGALSSACAAYVETHISQILQALRFQPVAVKWLIDEGFISVHDCAAHAVQASSFGQSEAAALLLEYACEGAAGAAGNASGAGAAEADLSAAFDAFDPFDLEL